VAAPVRTVTLSATTTSTAVETVKATATAAPATFYLKVSGNGGPWEGAYVHFLFPGSGGEYDTSGWYIASTNRADAALLRIDAQGYLRPVVDYVPHEPYGGTYAAVLNANLHSYAYFVAKDYADGSGYPKLDCVISGPERFLVCGARIPPDVPRSFSSCDDQAYVRWGPTGLSNGCSGTYRQINLVAEVP
jgi:hypothetical protein